jgi:drug/metabolite transporter (DMT)-like permease
MGWGVADFLGGLKSRQLPVITVLMLSNAFGTLAVTLIVCVRGKALPDNPVLLWAVIAGIIGILAMFSLYKGLSEGSMAVVAPISATGVILPVIFGMVQGESLTNLQLLGIISAITGSVFAGREKDAENRNIARGAGFAAAAALSIGLFYIVMDQASEADPYWAAFIERLSYGLFLTLIVVVSGASLKISRSHLPSVMLIGITDALAGFAFAVAATIGMISIVSVVVSLYPAVTVFLSAMILRERPGKVQSVGVLLALLGVVLISAY